MKERILQLSEDLHDKTVAARRDFHTYAESAWTEFRTSAVIAQRLAELGYRVLLGDEILVASERPALPAPDLLDSCWNRALREGANPEFLARMRGGLTGVVGILEGSAPGPTVGLRFDIDANDLNESQEDCHRPAREGFVSVHYGVCHACGHDAHAAIGLGVAEVLAALRSELKGKVKLIFQPGEEGMRGARPMVAAGLLDDVDYLMGIHVGLKANRTGMLIAGSYGFLATSKIDAYFKGVSAHAGLAPQEGKNALLAAAAAALSLHGISRHGAGPSRVNVGVLQAGSGRNVVAESAVLKFETRGLTTEINSYMETRAREVILGAAQMQGVKVDIKFQGGAPSGQSDQELVDHIKKTGSAIPGFIQIADSVEFGACEDFTIMMDRVQSRGGKATYILLGTDLASGHHTSRFDIDERSLTLGVQLLGLATASLLS